MKIPTSSLGYQSHPSTNQPASGVSSISTPASQPAPQPAASDKSIPSDPYDYNSLPSFDEVLFGEDGFNPDARKPKLWQFVLGCIFFTLALVGLVLFLIGHLNIDTFLQNTLADDVIARTEQSATEEVLDNQPAGNRKEWFTPNGKLSLAEVPNISDGKFADVETQITTYLQNKYNSDVQYQVIDHDTENNLYYVALNENAFSVQIENDTLIDNAYAIPSRDNFYLTSSPLGTGTESLVTPTWGTSAMMLPRVDGQDLSSVYAIQANLSPNMVIVSETEWTNQEVSALATYTLEQAGVSSFNKDFTVTVLTAPDTLGLVGKYDMSTDMRQSALDTLKANDKTVSLEKVFSVGKDGKITVLK